MHICVLVFYLVILLQIVLPISISYQGANILRDLRGNVKLADFGASKRLQVTDNNAYESSVNLVPRVSLLCLPWSLEERPWLRLVT